MSPIVKREEAKDSGWAQVREHLTGFEGDVITAEFGQWGGKLVDDDGKVLPPKEFLEVFCSNVKVTATTEELAFTPVEYSFRVNCSDFKGSFWIDKFLESADNAKLLIPDELIGKRIAWKKDTLVATDPKYNSTNFVIDKVVGGVSAPTSQPEAVATEAVAVTQDTPATDPMRVACELAVGKTETQFRSAISLHPLFVNSPLLPLAKAGAITAALVKEGKLTEVKEGNKTVYAKGV